MQYFNKIEVMLSEKYKANGRCTDYNLYIDAGDNADKALHSENKYNKCIYCNH